MGIIFILILYLNLNILLILFLISYRIFNFNYYSIFGEYNNSTFNILETYECRFDTFHNKMLLYNLQFFNIGVSYIVFDLEIAIIFTFLILTFNYFSYITLIFLILF